jgi:hypothetical protein
MLPPASTAPGGDAGGRDCCNYSAADVLICAVRRRQRPPFAAARMASFVPVRAASVNPARSKIRLEGRRCADDRAPDLTSRSWHHRAEAHSGTRLRIEIRRISSNSSGTLGAVRRRMSNISRALRQASIRHGWLLLSAWSGCVNPGESGTDAASVPSEATAPAVDSSSSRGSDEDGGRSDAMVPMGFSPADGGTLHDLSLATPPSGWVQTPERCGIRLWAPLDVVEIATQGDDSCAFRFRTERCEIGGGSGAFSDQLEADEEELDHSTAVGRLDGREVKLVQYRLRESESHPYVAAARVPLPSTSGWGLAASLHAQCSSAATREEGLLSLRSARIRETEATTNRPDAGIADAGSEGVDSRPIPILVGEDGSVSVETGEVFTLLIKYVGNNGTLEPQVSSSKVRFVGIDETPSSLQTPGGPVRSFRFQARETGSVELTFPAADRGDAGTPSSKVVTVHIR